MLNGFNEVDNKIGVLGCKSLSKAYWPSMKLIIESHLTSSYKLFGYG